MRLPLTFWGFFIYERTKRRFGNVCIIPYTLPGTYDTTSSGVDGYVDRYGEKEWLCLSIQQNDFNHFKYDDNHGSKGVGNLVRKGVFNSSIN